VEGTRQTAGRWAGQSRRRRANEAVRVMATRDEPRRHLARDGRQGPCNKYSTSRSLLIAAQLSLSARRMTTGRGRNRAGAGQELGLAPGGRPEVLRANVSRFFT
jgi:hypothetical protein